MRPRIKLFLAISIIPQYLLLQFLRLHPDWIENYYSRGLYTYLNAFQNRLFGSIPFSVGDLMYIIVAIWILRWVLLKSWRSSLKDFIFNIGSTAAVIFFIFHLMWGLNYHRLPLAQQLSLSTNYTTEQLIEVTNMLIQKSNNLQIEITKNDSLPVHHNLNIEILSQDLNIGFDVLSRLHHNGVSVSPSTKVSLLSTPLTYMGFSGYLNPFTLESQVNNLIPSYALASTIAHERVHKMGYAAENEANFLGILACHYSDQEISQYSGAIMALRICLNELYKVDQIQYHSCVEKINFGILMNYNESSLFWNSYQNPFEPLFKKSYNQYLKSNAQNSGIKSYNEAVGLIVNFFRTLKQ